MIGRCIICGAEFANRSRGTPRTTCSSECKKTWRSADHKEKNRVAKALGERSCLVCGKTFRPDDFRGNRRYCSPTCRLAGHRRIWRGKIESRYGITLAEWDALFAAQGNACAICRRTDSGKKTWSTDHDHSNGVVRGILCGRCNTGLGLFMDDPSLLAMAADYLRKHREPRLATGAA